MYPQLGGWLINKHAESINPLGAQLVLCRECFFFLTEKTFHTQFYNKSSE